MNEVSFRLFSAACVALGVVQAALVNARYREEPPAVVRNMERIEEELRVSIDAFKAAAVADGAL